MFHEQFSVKLKFSLDEQPIKRSIVAYSTLDQCDQEVYLVNMAWLTLHVNITYVNHEIATALLLEYNDNQKYTDTVFHVGTIHH